MKSIRALLPFLRGKWPWVGVYTLSNLLSVIFSTATLYMIGPFLSMLFGQGSLPLQKPVWQWSKEGLSDFFNWQMAEFIREHNNDKAYGLILICAVVVGTTLFKNVFLYIAKYTLHPLRNNIVQQIRGDLYNKLLHLPVGFFSNERKGDMLSRITNDVNAVEVSIISLMELLFSTPVTVLFYFFVLLYISPQLFLFLLVLLPLAGILIGRISKSLKRSTLDNQERLADILSHVEETLGGLRIIKAFRAETPRSDAFNTTNRGVQALNNRIAARRELASPMSEFLGILILSIIIWFGGKMALQEPAQIAPGLFIMFISLFYFLITPLKALSQIFYNLHQGEAGLQRIQQVMEAPNPIQDTADAKPLSGFKHSIEFKNVSFAYDGKTVLRNINLHIPKGKTVALVGASGAGKSTLVDLIPRFHDVSEGQILLDGIDIREYRLNDLRGLMGIVTQEPVLFNDTMANNIALGETLHTESMQRIHEAARLANAAEFIAKKEGGYNAMVGDRGAKLSGGEKQRLTIARALYKNPPLLLLDEATSSLDTVSERQVQDAIDQLMQHRTSVVIAHRLSTVQHADEIIVLDHGEIKERGTHAALIAQGGLYKQLVSMQQVLQ
jgi:subfamily B ATP-binding cassette protein MsbA